jgi:flagellar motor protein MotB
MTYRGQRRGAILHLACLAIVCATALAQNQPNAQSAPATENSQQSQPPQDQPQQNQTQEQTPQNQPTQSQPSQSESSQSAAQKKKDITQEASEETRKFGEETLNRVVDWEKGWLTGPYVGKNRPLVAMTAQQRREIYLQQTFTAPSDYFKRMVSAAVDQWRGSPPQWPEGWGGYGERFASREGQFIAANSLAALGDAKLKYEPRYDQCKCSGFRLRTRHAILRNFLTYNQSEQELRPQWALYGGAFAGGVISSAWKPYPRNVLADGGWGVLGQAGYGALLNFFTEFAGDINRKLTRKR